MTYIIAATPEAAGNSLDEAYNHGMAGGGRIIIADAGPVEIQGPNGLIVTGNVGIGASPPASKLDVSGSIRASSPGGTGVLGTGGIGAIGITNNFIGVLGASNGPGVAGFFVGDVFVTGLLSKAGGSFKIDHPADPANKYFSHSFVESPDMMNIYNGNVVTDEDGKAWVSLPTYFELLNRDFRYQLTVIGQFAQAVVDEEVKGNRFLVRTNRPRVKVSWQVTGIRKDPWAEAHRIVAEEPKNPQEQGRYLHPELYGQPADSRVHPIPDLARVAGLQEAGGEQ